MEGEEEAGKGKERGKGKGKKWELVFAVDVTLEGVEE